MEEAFDAFQTESTGTWSKPYGEITCCASTDMWLHDAIHVKCSVILGDLIFF